VSLLEKTGDAGVSSLLHLFQTPENRLNLLLDGSSI
jgi:hypothetical protein